MSERLVEEQGGICICPACGALSTQGSSRDRDAEPSDYRPEAGWLPLIHASIQEVFGIMLGCQTGPSVAEIPGSATITAMVGLAGKLRGMMRVRCSERAACGMASAMLETSIPEKDQRVQDALGEVCNMVAGNFKAKLVGMADGCSLSVPTIITGDDYRVHPLPDGERVVVACSFYGEPVWVTIDLNR